MRDDRLTGGIKGGRLNPKANRALNLVRFTLSARRDIDLLRLNWRQIGASVLVCLSLALCACADSAVTPTAATPVPAASSEKATSQGQSLRVIVKFRQPVAYNDAAFLTNISQQIGTQLVYLSSVSTDTHVYLVKVQASQKPEALLQRLSAVPDVLRVEVDSLAQPS